MLSLVAVERSLISEILDFIKFSLLSIPDNFKSFSILNGPLFLKKGLIVIKVFFIKTLSEWLSRFVADYFLSTIVADH